MPQIPFHTEILMSRRLPRDESIHVVGYSLVSHRNLTFRTSKSVKHGWSSVRVLSLAERGARITWPMSLLSPLATVVAPSSSTEFHPGHRLPPQNPESRATHPSQNALRALPIVLIQFLVCTSRLYSIQHCVSRPIPIDYLSFCLCTCRIQWYHFWDSDGKA